jgi:hypothetical protein
VVQYFVAEAAVIGAWAGPEPYDRRTGYISDLGAVSCGVFDGRGICSPLHLLMNASFVVQGLGMLLGALLLSSALLSIAARPGIRVSSDRPEVHWLVALVARVLTGSAGLGTMLVGLVPEDVGSAWHFVGAVMYFTAGSLALLLLGGLWLKLSSLGWFIMACGALALGALITGGITRMAVPEPGTLERLMAYPITIGLTAVGLVIAQRVQHERHVRKVRARAESGATQG